MPPHLECADVIRQGGVILERSGSLMVPLEGRIDVLVRMEAAKEETRALATSESWAVEEWFCSVSGR